MGVACTRPPAPPPNRAPAELKQDDMEEPEYFGPPGTSLDVPLDLNTWKSRLSEQRKQDKAIEEE